MVEEVPGAEGSQNCIQPTSAFEAIGPSLIPGPLNEAVIIQSLLLLAFWGCYCLWNFPASLQHGLFGVGQFRILSMF